MLVSVCLPRRDLLREIKHVLHSWDILKKKKEWIAHPE